MAVDPALKDRIQSAYSSYLKGTLASAAHGATANDWLDCQLSVEIEVDGEGKRVSPPRVCVIEAGTGTGKTLAYLVGTLPLQVPFEKKLSSRPPPLRCSSKFLNVNYPVSAAQWAEFSAALAKAVDAISACIN